MRIKNLLGMNVVDTNAKVVGKIEDLDFDQDIGKIQSLIISHKNNIISNKEITVSYSDIENLGDYVLLNIAIDLDSK
ncbi:MAG: PRC-barrel domain-containing protein [Methanobrevibacter sp.]|jgi:sporulation protein YlmC with PRC-barrel domain|nr:PRC-barrel domain-containing protein [Candidatus Methanovirga basalitermitum]